MTPAIREQPATRPPARTSATPHAWPPPPPAGALTASDRHRSDFAERIPQAPVVPVAAGTEHPTLSPPPSEPKEERLTAILRALPRRTQHDPQTRRLGRIELLAELAQGRSQDATRARLLSSAAALQDRAGHSQTARNLREQAFVADPTDLIVLRELRRHAIAEGDLPGAAAWLGRELKVPAHGTERASAATLLSMIQDGALQPTGDAETTARRARAMAKDESFAALLRHAAALKTLSEPAQAAATLEKAATLVQERPLRAALLLQAAQCMQAAGQDDAVLPLLSSAALAMPNEVTLHLEVARIARRTGRLEEAVAALDRATRTVTDAETVAALKRMQAQLLLTPLRQPEAARELLGDARSAADLYLRARTERRAGGPRQENAELAAALRGWAFTQSGGAKVAALCELARHLYDSGEGELARASLQEAERIAPGSPLVRLARSALLRHDPAPADLKEAAAAAVGTEGLSAVARLAFSQDLAAECELIGQVPGGAEHDTVQQLQLDAALHTQATGAASAALWLWADQLEGQRRAGPLLAALSITRDPEATQALLEALQETAGDAPAVTAERLHRAPDRLKPALWRREGERSAGAFAAHCYLMAALSDPDADPGQAIRDLQQAVTQHGAAVAAFELEHALHGQPDPTAEAALHEALAALASGPVERARRLYAAAACAGLSPDARKALLLRAQAQRPTDIIIGEALLDLTPEAPAEERAMYLFSNVETQDPASRRVTHLRAATEFERGERLTEALSHYQHVLGDHLKDAFARAGVIRCLERQGSRSRLADLLHTWYERSQDEAERCRILIQIQTAMRGRSDVAVLPSLALSLQRSSAHVPTLRALERIYGRLGKPGLLREATARLSRQLGHRKDRTAYLRLWLRLTETDGGFERFDDIVLDAVEWADHSSPWYGLCLEGAARRRGDAEMIVRAVDSQRRWVAGADDQACLGLRAAEALEPISPAKAAAALLHPARRSPHHPTAAEELGRLCKAQGDYETAAAAYRKAATTAAARTRKLWLLYVSGILYQEPLSQPEQACDVFGEIAALDPNYLDVLPRLSVLLRDLRRYRELADLYHHRLRRESDPQTRARLGLEQHRLYMLSGEYGLAEGAIDTALKGCPERVDLLHARADLLLGQRRFREAVEVLLALARRTRDQPQLRFALLQLGKIYLHHLPNLRQAEAALVRCLQLDGQARDALEALAELYDRDGRSDHAARVLGRLVELSDTVADAERYTLRRAELLNRNDRPELAIRTLREFLVREPLRLSALRTLVSIHRARQDEDAARAELAAAAQGYKKAALANPSNSTPYYALREALRLWRRPEAEAAISTLIDALSLDGSGVPGGSWDTTDVRLTAAVRDGIMPASLNEPARRLLRKLAVLMEATHPAPAPPTQGLLPSALVNTVEAALVHVAARLGIAPPEVRQGDGAGIYALRHEPPLLLLGRGTRLEPPVLATLAMRCLLLIDAGLGAVTRLPPAAFAGYVHAVRLCLDEHHALPDDVSVPPDLLEAVRRQIGRQGRSHWVRLLTDALGPTAVLSPERLRTAAAQYGTRAALLLGERPYDVFLLALHDDGLTDSGGPLHAQVARSPAAQQLLAFTLSEDYLLSLQRARIPP